MRRTRKATHRSTQRLQCNQAYGTKSSTRHAGGRAPSLVPKRQCRQHTLKRCPLAMVDLCPSPLPRPGLHVDRSQTSRLHTSSAIPRIHNSLTAFQGVGVLRRWKNLPQNKISALSSTPVTLRTVSCCCAQTKQIKHLVVSSLYCRATRRKLRRATTKPASGHRTRSRHDTAFDT